LDVHFLLRSDFEHVRDHGLRVESPKGDFSLPKVKAYARPEDMPRCDVAAVAWKTTENRYLAEVLPKVVKPGGVVLVLQNGLDPERDAAPHVRDLDAKVLSGLCFLSSRKLGPGHVLHQDFGAITLAAYGEQAAGEAGKGLGVTGEMREVAADFGEAGVEIRLHESWRAARWRKLVWNVPFNGLCALHGLDTRKLLARPDLKALARRLMEEVLAGAALEGCALPDGFADRMMKDTEAMVPYEPSMKLDLDSGRPMELDAIYARTVAAIRKAGGEAPLVEELLERLRALEAANLA
jgi:2-dehydropantoate 2-reductase